MAKGSDDEGTWETCSAHGCPRLIPATRMFCRAHWKALPDYLQHEIADAVMDQRTTDLSKLRRRAISGLALWEQKKGMSEG